MIYILAVAGSYLLGSVIFSYVVGKLLKGVDVRKHGSGNAGATNTMRVLGKGPGIAVFVLDIAKGVAAVWAGRWTADYYGLDHELLAVLCGIAVVAGHNWPIYFGFRGGKGIATTIGMLATLAVVPTLIAGAAAILAIAVTRYVSLGSLVLTMLLPILAYVMNRPEEIWIAAIIMFILAAWRHRTNIARLLNGTENKLGAKKQA